jgi:hypothetical protein
MVASATLSAGLSRDFESCRADILAFLQAPPWQIAMVEVHLWAAGSPRRKTANWPTTPALFFSTVAKLVDALQRAIPQSRDLELNKKALRIGREGLCGTKYD